MQTTSHLLMIRPAAFAYNAETAVNNAFQKQTIADDTNERAQEEFDNFVLLLRANGVDVTVIQDNAEPHTPDSIFPNNWVSFHGNGAVVLYPMFAVNRRAERNKEVLEKLSVKFPIKKNIDLTHYESKNIFLEGTGSMILDRNHHIAYANLSPRTNEEVLLDFCRKMHYKPITFRATDQNGQDIYHTNVVMCLGSKFVVICMEAVKSEADRKLLYDSFAKTGKEVVNISLNQMNHFAGNMLQVKNDKREKLLIMSSQAYFSLHQSQITELEKYCRIIHSPLNIIEENGGGSARCMMAEVFLPRK